MATEKTIVLYHGPRCADGFTAAWIAWRALRDKAEYVPLNPTGRPPDVAGRKVVVLDLSFKRPVMEELAKSARSVVVLDHHVSAQKELDGFSSPNATIHFDMEKSGAMLAWHYFNPSVPAPTLVRYVQDRDLWAWKLTASREINAAISSYEKTFPQWDGLYEDLEGSRADFIIEGTAILRYQRRLVQEQVANAEVTDFHGYQVPVLNATCLVSEIGEELSKDQPFSVTYFVKPNGEKVYSLRSQEDGMDVSEVARKLGGGGHKHAAGVTL